MKAKIYYQDFKLNAFCNEQLRFDPENAYFIGEVDSEEAKYTLDNVLDTKEQFADFIYKILNTEPDLFFPQEVFKAVGHTSMSIGDYIFFEEKNGEEPFYMMCASSGWHIIDLDFEERRHKVAKFIKSLSFGTIEGIFRELEKNKGNEVSNILSDNFHREQIRCENYCPRCGADENEIDWGILDIIGDSPARNSTCQKCKTNFTEYYTYSETQIEEDVEENNV